MVSAALSERAWMFQGYGVSLTLYPVTHCGEGLGQHVILSDAFIQSKLTVD